MDELIFVTAGKEQTTAIKKANQMGWKTIGIDLNPNAVGLRHCFKKITGVDFNLPETILEKVQEICDQPKGAISFCSDSGQLIAAQIREHLQLPGDDLIVTRNFRDKSTQREIWDQVFPTDFLWRVATSYTEALEIFQEFIGKVVIKPVDSSGSRGVSIVERHRDPRDAIETAFLYSNSKVILIEEYIEGVEFTVDSFSLKGEVYPLLVTRKKKASAQLPTVAKELEVLTPQDSVWENILRSVTLGIKALGKMNGPTHTEVIVTPRNHVHLIESSARGGGFGLASRLIPMATGVDYTSLCVREAMGMPIDVDELKYKDIRSGILRFLMGIKGTVNRIEGFEMFANKENIFCEPLVNLGDQIKEATADADRLASFFVVAEDSRAARKLVDQIEQQVKIIVI